MKETSASDPKPSYRSFSYPTGQFAVQIFELVVTAIFLLVLWAIRRDRRSFFLAKGALAAPLERVRWLVV